MASCMTCGDEFPAQRLNLGYRTCLPCGAADAVAARASWCTVPMNKSNYMLVTNPDELKQLNPKRQGD